MATFSSDGVEIYYEVSGEGAPVVLVHGFASDLRRNWKDVGWFQWLNDAGYQVIALDCRGHGKSEKLYGEGDYYRPKMAKDVVNLLDNLGLETAFLMGYSMGGMISTLVIENFAPRIRKAVLAGVGGTMLIGRRTRNDAIAEALLADDVDGITNITARGFRIFAEKSGGDLKALATIMQTDQPLYDKDALAKVEMPVLVVAGEKDDLVGDPQELADAFPDGQCVIVPRRDHLTAVGDKIYRDAVLDFLKV